MENKKHYLFEIKALSDKNGLLSVIEGRRTIPFAIKRVFYEYNVSGLVNRGEHANKKSCFCFIALSGSCDVIVNDGKKETLYRLDKPTKVLYIDKLIWKTMNNFSNNCVLLVLSDSYYDPDEYIRNYDEYISLIKND